MANRKNVMCLVVTQAKEKLKQEREWSIAGGFAVSDGQAVGGPKKVAGKLRT